MLQKKPSEIDKLRTILFNSLERLNEPTCDIEKETKRVDSISRTASVIVNSYKQEVDMARLQLEARKQGLISDDSGELIALPGGKKKASNE